MSRSSSISSQRKLELEQNEVLMQTEEQKYEIPGNQGDIPVLLGPGRQGGRYQG